MSAYALDALPRGTARKPEEAARQAHQHVEERPIIAPTVTLITVFPGDRC